MASKKEKLKDQIQPYATIYLKNLYAANPLAVNRRREGTLKLTLQKTRQGLV